MVDQLDGVLTSPTCLNASLAGSVLETRWRTLRFARAGTVPLHRSSSPQREAKPDAAWQVAATPSAEHMLEAHLYRLRMAADAAPGASCSSA